jgi:hypothetical protein
MTRAICWSNGRGKAPELNRLEMTRYGIHDRRWNWKIQSEGAS